MKNGKHWQNVVQGWENDGKFEKRCQDDGQEQENNDQNCKKDYQEEDSEQERGNESLIFYDEKMNIQNEQKGYV